jgi:hypothetical protein
MYTFPNLLAELPSMLSQPMAVKPPTPIENFIVGVQLPAAIC